MMSTSDASVPTVAGVTDNSYRTCLKVAVAALLKEKGFDTATPVALESLLEVLQAFMCELGRSARAFTEVACRSEPMHTDVLLALAEMGMTTNELRAHAFRPGRPTGVTPSPATPYKPTAILRTGDGSKAGLPGLPDLPDRHAYVRTPTHRQPVTDYEGVREKAAAQKRDVERALTRFVAKTNSSSANNSLFATDDTNLFPLIAAGRALTPPGQPRLPAYVAALLFKDQLFEEDESEFLPKRKKEDEEQMDMEDKDESKEEQEGGESGSAESKSKEEKEKKAEKEKEKDPNQDNPFLKQSRSQAIRGTPIKRKQNLLS